MKTATIILVRPHPKRIDESHPADLAAARAAAQNLPCWVLLVGKGREKRRDTMRQELGLGGIAKDGLSVHAPVEVAGEDDADTLAGDLARYLADVGLRMSLRESKSLEVRLPSDLDPALLAAVMEAVAVHPNTDVYVGDRLLRSSLRWELRRDKFRAPPAQNVQTDLIGSTPAIEKVRAKVARYADKPFPVLIIGETGTGKEVVATMLHEQSGRQGRFMGTNAAQLPPELADSLLFGHRKGSFTGADTDRAGRIREAEGGTFFLDEAFNLNPAVQGKLLRALNQVDEGVLLVEPLGSTRPPESVHARLVVSALGDPRGSHENSGSAAMRTDLFYRVSAGIIRLPPLRQGLDDLPALCAALLMRITPGVQVSEQGIATLREHNWPGNIRELRLVLLRALMDARSGLDVLGADELRAALDTHRLPPGARSLPLPCNLDRELARIELATLQAAMRETGHNQARAGRRIGMDTKNVRNFGRRLETAERNLRDLETQDAE
jgi:DNA-binding NtrC family response regulator